MDLSLTIENLSQSSAQNLSQGLSYYKPGTDDYGFFDRVNGEHIRAVVQAVNLGNEIGGSTAKLFTSEPVSLGGQIKYQEKFYSIVSRLGIHTYKLSEVKN